MKTLRESKRSKNAIDTDKNISVGLSSSYKHIHNVNDSSTVNVDEVWKDECNSSKKYRLIFTINPVCSNVLYNALSEVVYDNGGEDMRLLSDTVEFANKGLAKNKTRLTRMQAIRDTEYSNPDIHDITYFPGIDILNNHIFRSLGFSAVIDGDRKPDDGYIYKTKVGDKGIELIKTGGENVDPFNTIRDLEMSSLDEKPKKEKMPVSGLCYASNATAYSKHLYQADSVKSFQTAIADEVSEKDGWFGFYNRALMPATISYSIPGEREDEEFYVNRVDNKSSAGDFIDFFPDRSRFSFVPHYNDKLKRNENNWSCFLTYPYKNDDKHEVVYDSTTKVNGLVGVFVMFYQTDSGKNRAMFASKYAKHNLDEVSDVRLYIQTNNGVKELDERVRGFGDTDGSNQDFFFSVDSDNLAGITLNEGDEVRFSKLVFGSPCKYYFRIFKRVPNFKTTNGSDDSYLYEDVYSDVDHEFAKEVNKLAFAKSAYGDDTVQIVFTDDIDLYGLKDNLGRPITELFLTVVKNNTEHDKWYSLTASTANSQTVEWSSCFGDITAGLDVPASKYLAYDYNVHRLHNVSWSDLQNTFQYSDGYDVFAMGYDWTGDTEYKVCVENRNFQSLSNTDVPEEVVWNGKLFYGDLVEFSPMQFKETTIGAVYHRFNTVQRELVSKDFSDIKYDEIYRDDYEGGITFYDESTDQHYEAASAVTGSVFACAEEDFNSYQTTIQNGGIKYQTRLKYPGNIYLEGYYYKPHYRVHIANYEENMVQSSDTQVQTDTILVQSSNMLTFSSDEPIYANTEMVILKDAAPYDNVRYGKVVSCAGDDENGYTVSVSGSGFTNSDKYIIFIKTKGIPDYAIRYPDTSGRYIWKEVRKYSDEPSDSALYDMPFANGAHYQHNGFNFFLRRQDPDGEYGLNITQKRLEELGIISHNSLWQITRTSKNKPELNKTLDFIKTNILDIC